MDKLFPKFVKSVTFLEGKPGMVSSQVQIEYQDGAIWVIRLMEISDINNCLIYEVISAKPELEVTSIMGTIRLMRVTDTNQTFVEWTTSFSSDVTTGII